MPRNCNCRIKSTKISQNIVQQPMCNFPGALLSEKMINSKLYMHFYIKSTVHLKIWHKCPVPIEHTVWEEFRSTFTLISSLYIYWTLLRNSSLYFFSSLYIYYIRSKAPLFITFLYFYQILRKISNLCYYSGLYLYSEL